MGLRNIVSSERKMDVEYRLVFDDGRNNGYAFPCNEDGTPSHELTDCAVQNLMHCIEHPDEFVRWNEVVKRECWYTEPAHGTCDCGNEVYLMNEYMGACQCDQCGKWYNLFGQELLSPQCWGGLD